MKKILIVLVILGSFLQAKIVDKIIISVNDEPITSYDLKTTMKNMKLSKKSAIDYLIGNALIDSEIKKRGIEVDDYEVDERLDLIAKQNGITTYKLKQYLLSKGQLESFIAKTKRELEKQKLFKALSYAKISVNDYEIKDYYENNIKDFTYFKEANVTKQSSVIAKDLETIRKNPLANVSVKTKQMTVYSKTAPFTLMKLIDDTKVNHFTPILRDISGYVMFFVNSKTGKYIVPMKKVKNVIANVIAAQKRDRIIKNYFQKEKSKAVIKKFFN